MSTINLLLPDQLQALRELGGVIVQASGFDVGCRLLVERVAQILDTPAVLVQHSLGRWRVAAKSPGTAPSEAVMRSVRALCAAPANPRRRVLEAMVDLVPWTCLALQNEPDNGLLLMLAGDWTLSEPVLDDVAARFGGALRNVGGHGPRPASSELRAAFALARRLPRLTDLRQICQLIVDATARAVSADQASIAVYDAEQDSLAIMATYGYPGVLVKHLRVRPGDGVIGKVFRSGRAIRSRDLRTNEMPKPRLRYRSTAFMSLPLMATDGVLGVLSMADRSDGADFSRADFRSARAMAGVASLALDRAQAAERANIHARMATVDELTGLFNRRHFQMRLEEEVERSRRQLTPLTLMLLDVDNFKVLNDQFGHPAGDAVLRIVGDVLRQSVRLFDVCARYGGDEFAILMPGSGPDSSRDIAERIREGVERARDTHPQMDTRPPVTTSIGIATVTGSTADELVNQADQALYVAKRQGKNRVGISRPSEAL